MRIAYVEDNAMNLALVQRIAMMSGHIITSFTEGEIALTELSRQTFDLILMDVELAGEMNGLQVVRTLRARGLTTPIIAVTAYAMLGDREKTLEAGCNEYLPKPLPISDFLALLARYELQVQARQAAPMAARTPTAPLVEPVPPSPPLPPLPIAPQSSSVLVPQTPVTSIETPDLPVSTVRKTDAATPAVSVPVPARSAAVKPGDQPPKVAPPATADPARPASS